MAACLRTEDTPLFLKIWFLGLPKQCSLLLLIGANLFGHHSLNLTSPILLLLPVNYNKTWNGMAAQARRGKGGKNKEHHRIKSRRVVSVRVMSLLFMILCGKVIICGDFPSLGLFYLPAALVTADLATHTCSLKSHTFYFPRVNSSKRLWVVLIFTDCKVLLKNLAVFQLFSK